MVKKLKPNEVAKNVPLKWRSYVSGASWDSSAKDLSILNSDTADVTVNMTGIAGSQGAQGTQGIQGKQ